MQNFYRLLRQWGKTAVRSIAFLPVPMMVVSFLLGFVLYYVETNTQLSENFVKWIPAVVITSQETARSILGLFIGGLITLVVFTFTQMMSLFNQVAGSYSPRLLSQFTGDRSLQLTMGFYLGTIIITLIVLLSIRSDDEGYVPNLSVLICILSGIISLCMFMYFATTISKKIQVGNIIASISERGKRAFRREYDRDRFLIQAPPADRHDWYVIASPMDGYIGTVDYGKLSELAARHGTRFFIGTAKGDYVPRNYPLLQSEKQLEEEHLHDILEAVSPIPQTFDDWYLPPLHLLKEVALKAMSPGINDPGTAIDAIDRLTGLLGRMMVVPVYNFYQARDGGEVWFSARDFPQVLREIMQALRRYCREDAAVCRRLYQMLYHLLGESGHRVVNRASVRGEILALTRDVNRHTHNPADRAFLAGAIREHRSFIARYRREMEFLGDRDPGQPGY